MEGHCRIKYGGMFCVRMEGCNMEESDCVGMGYRGGMNMEERIMFGWNILTEYIEHV
jgi:hypothetical protein